MPQLIRNNKLINAFLEVTLYYVVVIIIYRNLQYSIDSHRDLLLFLYLVQ